MIIEKEKIAILIPFLYPFLVFTSVLKATIYYFFFRIRIIDFLEFTEILTIFLDDLSIAAFTLILGVIVSYFNKDEEALKQIHEERQTAMKSDNFGNRLKFYLKHFYMYLVFMVIILSIDILIWYFTNLLELFTLSIAIYCLALFMAFGIMHEFKYSYQKVYKKLLSPTYFNLAILIILFYINLSFYTYYDIIFRKFYHKSTGSSFLIDSTWVRTDQKILFVGKTNNYVFMYNTDSNYSIIYPKERVKEYHLK